MQNTFQLLKNNPVVRIIAPGAGSPYPGDSATKSWDDLQKCCDLLTRWGLTPIYSPNIFGEASNMYNFANSDQRRYEDFVDAFQSDAAIIWSYRGGYGSDRIIQSVINNYFTPALPKLFIGFSDVTIIHSFIQARWQWRSLHALSLRQLGLNLVDAADVMITREIIFGDRQQMELALVPLNSAARKHHEIQGQITGGNLTVLQASFGTPWQAPIADKIVLLEDVGEAPYRIARIFHQILASDHLKGAKAFILGDFIPDASMDTVIEEFASRCPVPVLRCEGIGHGKDNHPVPFGTESRLVLGDGCKLVSELM
ncbi:MAG: LD-carboxypeptidase [Pseudomonadota bacterium]